MTQSKTKMDGAKVIEAAIAIYSLEIEKLTNKARDLLVGQTAEIICPMYNNQFNGTSQPSLIGSLIEIMGVRSEGDKLLVLGHRIGINNKKIYLDVPLDLRQIRIVEELSDGA